MLFNENPIPPIPEFTKVLSFIVNMKDYDSAFYLIKKFDFLGVKPVEAVSLLSLMIRRGVTPNAVAYNALMDGYCLLKKVDIAKKLFDSMDDRDDAPVNSSNSDDFAAFLDTELEYTSDASPEPEEHADVTHHSDVNRTKRQKIDVLESVSGSNDSTSRHNTKLTELRISDDEAARIRERALKNMLRHKKLCLVLDLDHTLLN
ncbi:RNA polymerase II C-terminal domain phosphatase-like protein 4 [Tanacetum coccineum]